MEKLHGDRRYREDVEHIEGFQEAFLVGSLLGFPQVFTVDFAVFVEIPEKRFGVRVRLDHVIPAYGIDVRDRHLALRLDGQKRLQEEVDSGALGVSSADPLPPPVIPIVKVLPVARVQVVQLVAFQTGTMEDEVLHQIRRQKGGSPGVERLEDQL